MKENIDRTETDRLSILEKNMSKTLEENPNCSIQVHEVDLTNALFELAHSKFYKRITRRSMLADDLTSLNHNVELGIWLGI